MRSIFKSSLGSALCLIAGLYLPACSNSNLTPVDLADPMVGTGFHGHTFPGATTPFGAVQFSPDTREGNWDACSGYHYSDSTINGFSLTHLSGTGCCDLGDVMFSPIPSSSPLPFSHGTENASPGFYEVTLRLPGKPSSESIKTEISAAPHSGIISFKYSKNVPAIITIDATHALDPGEKVEGTVTRINDFELGGLRKSTGWAANQYVYYAVQFSEPIATYTVNKDNSRWIMTFKKEGNTSKTVTARVGISAVSYENARQNLQAEIKTFDVKKVADQARKLWAEQLDKIQIEGGSLEERKTFYSALYHTMIAPNLSSDINGQFRGNNNQITTAPKGQKRYSTLSLWDTYRTWHPLMTILEPQLVSDMVNSMLDMYDASGELPIWPLASSDTRCMIGYHSASVIADAYLKGIGGFDPDRALKAMVVSSNINQKGGEEYSTLGFIPANKKREAASCHLEYNYDDWCIAQMANALGDTVTARKYYDRAAGYHRIFDSNHRFFRGLREDGNFAGTFAPQAIDHDLTEATTWQYRFSVPHDVNGLSNLFGSKENLAQAIDSMFIVSSEIFGELSDITGMIGQYAHGNEPSHHIAYLYDYLGQPWKTQAITRHLLKTMYAPTPEGISGNEDCGQMSAWYVMTALGLYPVCPGSGEYAITTPLFPKATISLPNGKKLTITANNPARNLFIKRLEFNGKEIDSNFITHAMLMEGGELKFELTDKPDKERGTAPSAAPYSMSSDRKVAKPFVKEDLYLFEGSKQVSMGSPTPEAEVHYTLDGSEPTENSPLYREPVTLSNSCTVRARAFKPGMTPSNEISVQARKAEYRPADPEPSNKKVKYQYFEGNFQRTADLNGKQPLKSGFLDAVSLSPASSADHFGFIFEGYVYAPKDGVYEFTTTSDDGSVLFVGNQLVVDNDGSHGAVTANGSIHLAKGWHPYRILFFEDYEGESLNWSFALRK